jgi:hypothetical protein
MLKLATLPYIQRIIKQTKVEKKITKSGLKPIQSTEVRFASFLSGGFTTMAVINPPEKKLAICTSVQSGENLVKSV